MYMTVSFIQVLCQHVRTAEQLLADAQSLHACCDSGHVGKSNNHTAAPQAQDVDAQDAGGVCSRIPFKKSRVLCVNDLLWHW